MYATNSLLVARGGLALSNGCRGVTSRSSFSYTTTTRNSGGALAATSAGATCAMCNSLRMTTSASTTMHLRNAHSSSIDSTASSSSLYGPTGSGWTAKELTGAILLTGAASAGSILLGPFDGLWGDIGAGGEGGGDGGPVGSNVRRPPVSEKCENYFESLAAEKQDQELGLGVAAVPRRYTVSARALRGGRHSMEDEFVVASGGRLSAVFDGHGGGGVSQYLRDRLHVILSMQLQRQEKAQKSSSKFQGVLKRFTPFGKKNNAQLEGGSGTENSDADANEQSSINKDDFSSVGSLPISAVAAALKDSFDQIDQEVLHNDEYDYQGSTAVAALLHEANDGTRTLLSANIGDSRGVLSRNGTSIDLTRDHKPNDDKEKGRILAMGEKIEWDNSFKVYRVRHLNISRAVGDRFAKPAVSGEVEIKRFPIHDKDEFIVLASDGLWDVMSSQEVVTYVHKRLNAFPKDGAKNMSRFVADEALRRGSGDNISVVIVWLS